MSNVDNSVLSGQIFNGAGAAIDNADSKIAKLMNTSKNAPLNEMQMMELNLAVSQRTTLMSLFSSVIKNLTDTEKQVANKI